VFLSIEALVCLPKKKIILYFIIFCKQYLHSLAGSKDVEYRLAQSGDATCTGLENSEFGARVMTLKRFGPAERCDFPKWFKEPKHWHSLNGEMSYNVHQK
jgi:hypothetical protein